MSGSKKEKSKSDKSKVAVASHKLEELENQFLLRMPEPYATSLHEALSNGSIRDRLQVEFEPDARHATVKFDHIVFSAKLVDMPCVVESWKTFDKKSLWKTGDICQLLICKDPEDLESSSDEDTFRSLDYFKRQQLQTKRFQYPHGLTPPLKNVRKRRFRKTARKKYVDPPEVEIEVKRLLRADVNAVKVRHEVINDDHGRHSGQGDQDDMDEKGSDVEVDVDGPTIDNFNENSNMSGIMSSDNENMGNASAEILPDISSSESDDDDDHVENPTSGAIHSASLKQDTDSTNRLKRELADVLSKKLEQQIRVERAANPLLRQRFQSAVDELCKDEERVRAELEKSGHF